MKNNSSSVTVKKLTKKLGKDNVVSIPSSLFENCNDAFNGTLQVGMDKSKIVLFPNFTDNIIEISEKLLRQFNLKERLQCNAIIKNNTLRLGPVIAAFISNGAIRKANSQKPNFRTIELMEANRDAKTILYFFSIKDVDFINNKINGTYFNEENLRWEQKWFPLPDVLYDRGGGVLRKQRIISKYIRSQLEKNKNLKKLNPQYFFDKWDVYQKLSIQDEMIPYLPVTIKYTKTKDLARMFRKNNVLYIKDCFGSNGRGIIRIIKKCNGTFEYSYYQTEIIYGKANSIKELEDIIGKYFKNKKIIIQTAIDTIKIKNRPIDMRATVQRDKYGKIIVASCPVRVGLVNSPITSTRAGANVYKFEEFFSDFLNYSDTEINSLKKRVDEFLITTYKCIEKVYGIFGEIGIDFAIDTNGLIWFIECNAKPGKDTVYLSYDKNTVRKVFLNPLEYSKYITGF